MAEFLLNPREGQYSTNSDAIVICDNRELRVGKPVFWSSSAKAAVDEYVKQNGDIVRGVHLHITDNGPIIYFVLFVIKRRLMHFVSRFTSKFIQETKKLLVALTEAQECLG